MKFNVIIIKIRAAIDEGKLDIYRLDVAMSITALPVHLYPSANNCICELLQWRLKGGKVLL